MMEEKIMTLHPEGKAGVNILKRRYDQVKEAILMILDENGGELTFKETSEIAQDVLKGNFDGKILWYVVTVKLDLEARGIIKRVPKTSPHRIRRVDA
ncbi:hypothetical protein QQ020_11225 [Fulvivirgaceae bacterium BMA12]|uniref:ArsR family transcriptional regulator n=1 Tax=Agaribacillus aureus TaxID=3051825 RepID=A0ABT8L4H2_9BACT|nr:hypothetical protein [Fulvivirgaceae bacterium BMA12]